MQGLCQGEKACRQQGGGIFQANGLKAVFRYTMASFARIIARLMRALVKSQ